MAGSPSAIPAPVRLALIYTRAEVGAFLTGVKNGEFDDLGPARPDTQYQRASWHITLFTE